MSSTERLNGGVSPRSFLAFRTSGYVWLLLLQRCLCFLYNILSFIFGYAEKQDLIEKNPMKKVDAPKVRRRAVDALSEEDARRFFEELNALRRRAAASGYRPRANLRQ